MKAKPALIFPCSYPLKVMGENTEAFAAAVTGIVGRHVAPAAAEYARQLSSGGRYLSITATFTAAGKEQLDALYQELSAHPLVRMVL